MFIKVHIRFFISVDNSDCRYKKPPASYLNKVQLNAKVHIAELQISQLLPYLEDILRISWAYLGHILGISWACLWHILGISWANIGNILAYLGNILGISWVCLGQILGIFWHILSIYRAYPLPL